MSSVQLLDKTRKIGKLLHNNNSSKVVFNDICTVMREILRSNVLVISKKGKVLGLDNDSSVEVIQELIKDNVGGFIDNMLNERMLSVLSTKENVNLETLGFENTDVKRFTAIIAPNKYATGDVFLSFEFQGIVYKVLANTDLCSEDFIQPGKHYHFDLTINKKASVNMSKVSLIGWEEEEFTKFGL